MATPAAHAERCAPSAAHRWLNCTASPSFEAMFTEGPSSIYAEEGTLAHSICELYANKQFGVITTRKFNSRLKALKESELYNEEMLSTAQAYADYLNDKALGFEAPPFVATEIRVDISDYVPKCFGTCDCVMIGGETLHITDYKHGKGVPVSAKGNPQMRLYALGALKMFSLMFNIKHVSMGICQPRLSAVVEEDHLSVEELLDWGESIKPIAQEAYDGPGTFNPGEHCRFCKGRGVCRARASKQMELEAYKDKIGERATPKFPEQRPELSDAEVGDLLQRGAFLIQWYSDLQAYALDTCLNGGEIPGFKAVEGRSNRAFTDADAALAALEAAGFDRAILYDYKPKSLSELEKVAGKKRFGEIVGDLITKPKGKPTLTTADDKRPPYQADMSAFDGVVAE